MCKCECGYVSVGLCECRFVWEDAGVWRSLDVGACICKCKCVCVSVGCVWVFRCVWEGPVVWV